MYLKFCEHRDIKISYKIIQLGFHEHSFFRIFSMLSRKAIFLAFFMKNMANPSGGL